MNIEGTILERSFRFPINPESYFAGPWALGMKYDVEDGRFVWFTYNDAKEMYEIHIR